MHPAPIGVAVRTGKKKSGKQNLNIFGAQCLVSIAYWRRGTLVPEGDIGAPIFTSTNSSVRLAYFHTNRLLFGLYKQETEILRRKDDGNIKK